ncbi:hypothetical protein MC885_003253 [Smutsia gigantea]|nr:hypothetical protein MC885_003253 [Smutsia gigantea]
MDAKAQEVNKVLQECLEPGAHKDLLETQGSQVTEQEEGANALLRLRASDLARNCHHSWLALGAMAVSPDTSDSLEERN